MKGPARLMVVAATLLACLGQMRAEAEQAVSPSRPGYLVRSASPESFGHFLIRVTDPGAAIAGQSASWSPVARHRYSSSQVWNADESLLAVDKGVAGILFLDGTGYRALFKRDVPGACEWHPLEPDFMICVHRRQVIRWNVRTDRRSVLFCSNAYGDLAFGPGKGNLSRDGRYIALRGEDADVAFVVDLSDGSKYPDIHLCRLEGANGYVTVSPSGRYLLAWQKVRANEASPIVYQTHVFTRDGILIQSWRENHRPGHGDLTLDADGSDVMVGVSKAGPDRHRVIKRRLQDGKVTVLTPNPGLAQHVSARNLRQPGWVYVTYGGAAAELANRSGWDPFYQEIVAVRLDGSGEMRPVTRTHSVRAGYLSEAHGSPSPDGRMIAFASNWDEAEGPIALYVVEAGVTGQAAGRTDSQSQVSD